MKLECHGVFAAWNGLFIAEVLRCGRCCGSEWLLCAKHKGLCVVMDCTGRLAAFLVHLCLFGGLYIVRLLSVFPRSTR